MGWLIAGILILLFTQHWVLALLLFIYLATRPQFAFFGEKGPSEPTPESTSSPQFSVNSLPNQEIVDLLILHLELERLLAAGAIDRAFYDRTIRSIGPLATEALARFDIVPKSVQWRQGRAAGWELLLRQQLIPPGPPPWQDEEQAAKAERTSPLNVPTTPAQPQPQMIGPVPPLTSESLTLLETPPLVPLPDVESSVQPVQAQTAPISSLQTGQQLQDAGRSSLSVSTPPDDDAESYAWQPTTPTALERALRAASGWSALIAPFFVQNIGWFIGGFCFVAGSIFLVSYTAGFAKALTVTAVLFTYTVFILWAGYQLRRRRPELATSSGVLMTLGVMLVPLDIAAAVRLIETAQRFPWLLLGILVAAANLAGLYFATTLVSGIMDRSLQGRQPQIFLTLTALQLAVPLLTRFPQWPQLAFLHLALLTLLAYGLRLFVQDWLHSIFVERRKIAYYAAGTLVYATLVSFLHLTWGYQRTGVLPAGYYAPFLMTLCGLLFYVDAQLKQWTKQYAFLSRLSFALYGLSVIALLLSARAPAARILTLLLAIGLYATVVWQYLTVPPLYLLLACLSWLYSLVILQHLPNQWYFLASLPGLIGLLSCYRWLLLRQAIALASGCYQVLPGLIFALEVWSLAHAQPGLIAMGTALVAAGVVFYGLQFAPTRLFGATDERESVVDLHNGPWLYTVTFMGSVALMYAPQWTGLSWVTQGAFGLILLACGWGASGLHLRRTGSQSEIAKVVVLLNSALLDVGFAFALSVLLAVPDLTRNHTLPFLLSLIGGSLLWLSLELRAVWLFYGVMGTWGVAGALFKLMYFPGPSAGTVEMFLALAVWGLLWWLEHEPEEVKTLRREQAALLAMHQPPLTLLWRFPVSTHHTRQDMLSLPLRQTVATLWLVGMALLLARLLEGQLEWNWALSASLGAVGAVLGSGVFRQLGLLSLALLLGLAAELTVAFELGVSTVAGLSFAGALYTVFAWELGTYVLTHPRTPPLAKILHLGGSRALAEQYLHQTTFVISNLCVVVPLLHYGLFTPNVFLLLTLVSSMVFLWLAGQRYRQQLHSYVLLSIGVLGALLSYAWVSPFSPSRHVASLPELLDDHGLGFLFALLSLFLWLIAQGLTLWKGDTDKAQADFAESLYQKPLCIVAAVLASCAASQQLVLVWSDPVRAAAFLPIIVLFLAGAVLLLTNQTLGHPTLSLAGILLPVLAVLWTEAACFHPLTPFSLWPDGRAFTDQWLTLSFLAVGLATLARAVGRDSQWEKLYIQPLFSIAVGIAGWALLGSFVIFVPGPSLHDFCLSGAFLTLTVFFLLVAQSSKWHGFPWLAGLTLACVGLSFNAAWASTRLFLSVAEPFWLGQPPSLSLTAANMLWLNLLLQFSPWWRKYEQVVSARLSWQKRDLTAPLLFWPSAFLLSYVVWFALEQTLRFFFLEYAVNAFFRPSHVLIGSLLTLSFLHLLWLHRAAWTTHALICSLLFTPFAAWLTSTPQFFHLPLFLALWSAVVLSAHFLWEKHQWGDETTRVIGHALSQWPVWSLTTTVIVLALLTPYVPLVESLATLAILTGGAASLGWQRQQRHWLLAALTMFLVLLHGWLLLWVPFAEGELLLPWYALQLALVAWLFMWLQDRFQQYQEGREPAEEGSTPNPRLMEVRWLLSWAWPRIAALGVVEWTLHELYLFIILAVARSPQWLITKGDPVIALLAAALLLALGIRQASRSQQTQWIYGVATFGGAIVVYVRLLLVGLAPPSVWDTTALMSATYALFILQRVTHSEPLFRIVLVLPLLTLLTVPCQFASPHATGTLLTAGTLYLLTYRETERSLPLHLALLAFNAAVYLWVPGWADRSQLFQVYAVPAALSVLLLLHLHREELKPRVLRSARLAATSVLYVSATMDVFLRGELTIFIVVLALSLAGIILGIALRTRAFLYGGVTSLLLNILGQLILLFPEQRLGKAIVLLVLGAVITGGMVWFSLQRELILQRIRIFRADLENWA